MIRLKELKKLYNLTQADLANVLGTKQQQISRYETEERELKASQIIELCKHYNKYSERVSRLFLAGYPFFSNYLKLYPTRTKKTAAKANKKQRKTEHKESGKADRKERNNHKQKPKTKTTPRNHNI